MHCNHLVKVYFVTMHASQIGRTSHDEGLFMEEVQSASTEEKLLVSYDRFYKAVNKIASKETEATRTLPSFDATMGSVRLPTEILDDVKFIWSCAEKFTQLQEVIQKFHRYRSDLVKKWKKRHQSLDASSNGDLEEGIKALLHNQSKLEQQLNFSNTLLVAVDQKMDQLPSMFSGFVSQMNNASRHREENQVLKRFVDENQQQMERLEQIVLNVDAKLTKWGIEEGGMTFPSTSWPETVHNNIIFSGSDESSVPEMRNNESKKVSKIPKKEFHDKPSSTQRSARMAASIGTTSRGSVPSEDRIESRNSDFGLSEPATDKDVRKERRQRPILKPNTVFVDSDASLSHPSSPSSIHPCNKRHEEPTKISSKEKRGISEEFKETFLDDVMRVQENLLTSPLFQQDEKTEKRELHSHFVSHLTNEANKGRNREESISGMLRLDSVSVFCSTFSDLSMSEVGGPSPTTVTHKIDN